MEFIGPIINFIKDLCDGNKGRIEKFNSFLKFLKNFNFSKCQNCLKDIFQMVEKTIKINRQIDKNLSNLISESNEDFSEEKN